MKLRASMPAETGRCREQRMGEIRALLAEIAEPMSR
jgi:hypothetical protein